jgi:hypothetical protein
MKINLSIKSTFFGILILSFSGNTNLFAQIKIDEKISYSISKFSIVDQEENGEADCGYHSWSEISAGIRLVSFKNPFFDPQPEIEIRYLDFRGDESVEYLGGSYHFKNVKGCSFISAMKLLPRFRLKAEKGIIYAKIGPLVGLNLYSYRDYDWRGFRMNDGNFSGHASEKADAFFNKWFYGGEFCLGKRILLKTRKYVDLEFGAFYNHHFAKLDWDFTLNRMGLTFSIVNPSGFIK